MCPYKVQHVGETLHRVLILYDFIHRKPPEINGLNAKLQSEHGNHKKEGERKQFLYPLWAEDPVGLVHSL